MVGYLGSRHIKETCGQTII